jgi:mono/diheme cytochrome c family protein
MRLVRRSIGLAAVAAGLVLGSGVALAQGNVAKGKDAYMKYGCWQCHGTIGQGSPITGPKLAPEPMPLEAMSTFVRNSRRTMPPYREAVLPNADLADIHAYLSSIPKSADYKSIPLLGE